MKAGHRLLSVSTWITGTAVFSMLLGGCGTTAFRDDFKGYNSAYADMLNNQMLLNLARLDNGHPAQFLAIGAITDRYTFNSSASAGVNPAHTTTNTLVTTSGTGAGLLPGMLKLTGRTLTNLSTLVIGGSGSVTAGESNQPEFQWIPLNNETVTRQILDPVNPGVFYTLYQQGFPIDQLLRVTVERIEINLPNGQYLVLSNSPTRSSYIKSRNEWESFARFLRVCGMLRVLQRHGMLGVETVPDYVPMAGVEFTRAQKSAAPGGGGGGGGGAKGGGDAGQADAPSDPPPEHAASGKPAHDFEPTPEQVLTAEKDGYSLRKLSEGVWQLGKYQDVPTFKLRPGMGGQAMAVLSDPESDVIHDADDRQAAATLVAVLQQGFTILGRVDQRLPVTTKTHLILRSFSRTLEAVASEQGAFDELMADPGFREHIPQSELRPVLRTRWEQKKGGPPLALERPLVALNYSGKSYEITDPANQSLLDPNGGATWNRDVYRLVMELNSQVTVDISKFQRQVIELQQ